ncbi:hypothetical protein G7Z17_g2075 [Cylindrodendrum hubeiense]|uniref:N-acetyltransferase domain-containing protein n=1 Tax=Cylindrodendrum hubeiense TaxID=595255 RepID=A0A9P5HNY3_9HYPO|nr:hypothetical protein G7Z17_g2075 [Cylindrodendrum hubeiense]
MASPRHTQPPLASPPALPSFGPLRLAAPADIPRLGVVSTAGFCYSEDAIWDRPHHKKYPQSTINSFWWDMNDFFKCDEIIVVAAVDRYDPGESSKIWASIPVDNGWTPPSPGDEVVVGVGVWKLAPSSTLLNTFQNSNALYPTLPEYDLNDIDVERVERTIDIIDYGENKYFNGLTTLERLVVHPAYWKRGHGERLARWGMAMCDLDHIDQGVVASEMGATLFTRLGYERLTELQVEGDNEDDKGLTYELLQYKAAVSIE